MSDVGSYGNSGISSVGGDGSEGGVIGLGDDEGGVIGLGDDEGGDIGFGVGVVIVVVMFFIVFGRPHIFDSVVLTNLSFGLLGSHIFDFSAGEIVVLVGDGVTWAWLALIIPISNTALATAVATTIANAIPTDLIVVLFILYWYTLYILKTNI